MEAFIMKIICGNNGAMDCDELVDIGSGLMDLKGVFDIVFGNTRDFSVVVFNGKKRVIAKTNVRLCKVGGCENCTNLHLCKFYIYGDCKASRRRNGCRFCHDMNSPHNSKVLAENNLQLLDNKELRTLLLQNDNTLLPPVCVSFNEGSKEYGNCPEEKSCRRLHVCDKYIRGICDSGADCCRSHDFFEPHPMTTLQERGIPTDLITSMLVVYQNIRALRFKNNVTRGGRDQPKPVSEKTEICLYFVKGSCKQGGRCCRVHFNMPYRWEVQDKKGWSPLPNNEGIEKDYCNPAMIKSEGHEPVCFDTMTQGLAKVRRLSTVSSVQRPDFILTTEWAWYWEDECGAWIKYGSIGMHRLSSITIEDLERQYLEDNSVEVKFTAGNHAYQVSLQDMSQRNEKYSTVRRIRRRPVFVSSADAQKIRTSKRPSNNQNFKALPKHWDKSLIPETGHKKIVLQSSTEEYQKILDLFQKTMRGFKIHNIERIQNRSLWEVFQWQRDQMKKINTGKYSVEKFLFHGTDSKHVDSICKQNFDWRICGTHGTAYGKGSYFARDAKYSHSYTSSSGLKTMFVCRVLVGEYTKGNPSYARPPSKDGGDTIFYDSCVDDVRNPSIFVVFEKHQVYPEYLIQYDEDTWSSNTVTTYSLFSNPVQAPPSSSATSFALYNQLQAPLSSSATSSALSNQLQVPPSSSATSSALSKQVQAPPSSSATSFALSNQLQAPLSSSATSSALSNQLQVPPSSSAISSALSNQLQAPLSSSATSSASSSQLQVPPSSSATSSALSKQVQAPPSSSATSSALSNQLQAPASSGAISSKSSVNVIPTQLYWTSNSTQSSYSTNPSSSKSLYSPTHNTTTQYSGSTATYSFTQVGSKGTSTRPTTQSGSTSNYNQPYVYSKGTSSLMQESSQAGSRSNLSQGSSQAGSLRRQPATTPRYIVTSQKKDCIIL